MVRARYDQVVMVGPAPKPETAGIVREAGFTSAFTTGESFATLDGDPFQIPRFVMLESVGDVELAHRLLHSWRASGEPA